MTKLHKCDQNSQYHSNFNYKTIKTIKTKQTMPTTWTIQTNTLPCGPFYKNSVFQWSFYFNKAFLCLYGAVSQSLQFFRQQMSLFYPFREEVVQKGQYHLFFTVVLYGGFPQTFILPTWWKHLESLYCQIPAIFLQWAIKSEDDPVHCGRWETIFITYMELLIMNV